MTSPEVVKVFNTLVEDDVLLTDFWTAIEKAIKKAGLEELTGAQLEELFQYFGEQSGPLINALGGIHR